MDKENNNQPNEKNDLNEFLNQNIKAQMPALNVDVKSENAIVENKDNIDMNNVKSVFEDMNVSTQVVDDAKRPDSIDNSPIIPQVPQEEQKQQESQTSVHQSFNLGSTTIGTVKPDKQKSPIAMIVLFGALLAFMFFMPEAVSFFNETFGTDFNTHTGVSIEEIYENEEDESQKVVMYDLNDKTEIFIERISFKSFVKSVDEDEYQMSFVMKNTGTQLYNFKKKLYFDFFDENKSFIGRSYLENITQITGGISNNYKVNITKDIYDKAKKIELVQRTDDDYPEVTLVSNTLTCSNDKYNLVYTFDSNSKLTNIKDMYTYEKTSDPVEYSNDLLAYKTKVNNLDKIDGVTAVLTETDTGFMTSILIDYSIADYSKLSTDTNYYRKDTYAKVVSFEMTSKGYTCR